MNLLLDTHIFIWFSGEPEKLTQPVREALQDPDNQLFLSVASVWEMQIKAQLGRLTLPLPVKELVATQQRLNDLQILPLFLQHVWELGMLPPHHKDPFDRILIAQVLAEKWVFVTADSLLSQYSVPRLV